MTKITVAKYIPAPVVEQPPGTVQLTLDAITARQLEALLGVCNGRVFDDVFTALSTALDHKSAPPRLSLKYVEPKHGEHLRTCIDLMSRYEFVPRPK